MNLNTLKNKYYLIYLFQFIILVCLIIICLYFFKIAISYISPEINTNKETANNFLIYYKYFIFDCVFILIILIIFFIMKNISIEYLYLLTGLGIGLFYLLIMTPLSIPDEPHHYHSTHLLVNNLLLQENKYISKSIYFDYSNLPGHYNASSEYIRFANEGIHRVNNFIDVNIPKPYNIDFFICYLPQAFGVFIGRLLNLNFFGVFYLGRLTNLLFYIFCVFLAIKSVNEFKLPFFITGLLPMTLHQAASFSYDAFINGISIVFISYFIRILYETKKLQIKNIIILSITGILLAPAKIIYFPIVLLVFLALPEYFGLKKSKGYILATGMIIIGIAMITLFNYNKLSVMTSQPEELNWEGQHNYKVSFILEHPLQTIKIFFNTFNSQVIYYFQSMIGRFLSGLTLAIPEWYVLTFSLILFSSVFYNKKRTWTPKYLHKGLFLLIIISVILLIILSMFLGWTSDIREIILGVQGRYFIPLIPLGLLFLRTRWYYNNNFYYLVIICCMLGMQFLTIRYILNTTIGF